MQITIYNLSGAMEHGFVSAKPELCSVCGSKLTHYPIAFSNSAEKIEPTFDEVYHPYQCTGKCGFVNLAVYKLKPKSRIKMHYDLVNVFVAVPKEIPIKEVSPEIEKLSPSFISIYKQALATESLNLTQVTGLGLRKALEFLVKDYAISKYPNDEEIIKKKNLGSCISDYFKDDYLKGCAQRATWLGNDETHYLRLWENHDIEDLKKLIMLTLRWLEYALLSDKYFNEMPS